MAQGKVMLPHGAPWTDDLVSELMVFDAGKHDDQVDAASLIGRRLAVLGKGYIPEQERNPQEHIAQLMRPPTFDELLERQTASRKRGESGVHA